MAIKPPVELLTCADEPQSPELPAPGIERDRIVANWILDYRSAWGDCASKVAGLRAWAEKLPD